MGSPIPVTAAPIELLRTIYDPNPVVNGSFGFAMANYDRYVLVGATGSGTVYLMNHESGATLGTYRSPDASGNVDFGRNLSQIGDGRFAVGDPGMDISPHVRTGSVYIFDAATGQALHRIRNPVPGHFTYFGNSLEFTPGHLFASSNPSFGERGKVHVYDPDTGQLQNTVQGPDNTTGSWGFGLDMERYQGDLFVSAPGAFSAGSQTGLVYRYDGSTFQQEMAIAPPDPSNCRHFGWSMDTSDSLLLVGAPGTQVGGVSNVGAAYLFDATTGTLLRSFPNPSPREFGGFGNAVALVGNFAVINLRNAFEGQALVYNALTGDLIGTIADPGNGTRFAYNGGAQNGGLLSIGDLLLVSGIGNDIGKRDSGAMYLYSVPEPCTGRYAVCALGIIGALQVCGLRLRSAQSIVSTFPCRVRRDLSRSRATRPVLQSASRLVESTTAPIFREIFIALIAVGLFFAEPFFTSVTKAAPWNFSQMLVSGDVAQGDEFGRAVDISGSYAIVGELLDDHGGFRNNGAAHVFELRDGTWHWTAKLVGSGYAQNHEDYLGAEVAIEDRYAVLGAPSFTMSQPAVVYERQGQNWTPISTLTPSELSPHFGKALDIDGDRIVVGGDRSSTRDGAVYIFERSGGTWTQATRIVPNDQQDYSEFGSAVALNGDSLVVGAWDFDSAAGLGSGAAYVFEHMNGSWLQTAKLTLSDAMRDSRFGRDVDFDGSRILIGADTHSHSGVINAGVAVLFERVDGTWQETARLAADTPAAFASFGYSVVLDGDRALIAAIQDQSVSPNYGAAYVFEASPHGWQQVAKLSGGGNIAGRRFGIGADIEGEWIMIGADETNLDMAHSNAGAVYVYTTIPEPRSIVLAAIAILGFAGTRCFRQALHRLANQGRRMPLTVVSVVSAGMWSATPVSAETRLYFSMSPSLQGHLAYTTPGTNRYTTIFTGPEQGRPMFPGVLDDRLYWTTYYPGQLRSASADGVGVQTLVDQGTDTTTRGIQFHEDKVYWSNEVLDAIYRGNPDGSSVETVISGFGTSVYTKVFDFEIYDGRFYWTAWDSRLVYTTRLDGSDYRQIDIPGTTRVFAIEVAGDRLYLSDHLMNRTGRVFSTNLEGGDLQPLINGPLAHSLDIFGSRLYYNDESGTFPISSIPLNGGSPRVEIDRLPASSWQIWLADVTLPPAIGFSEFNEPSLGSGNYTPLAGAQELGFRTSTTSTGGQNPFTGVSAIEGGRVLAHQSLAATTTFDIVDLQTWTDAYVQFDLLPSCTMYEPGDFVRVLVTNGSDVIDLVDAQGNNFSDDPIETHACRDFKRFSIAIPNNWMQASLVFTSSSNSSTGAERYELANVRFSGTTVIPEPSCSVMAFVGSILVAVYLRRHRRRRDST
jgi:hypothetical protein